MIKTKSTLITNLEKEEIIRRMSKTVSDQNELYRFSGYILQNEFHLKPINHPSEQQHPFDIYGKLEKMLAGSKITLKITLSKKGKATLYLGILMVIATNIYTFSGNVEFSIKMFYIIGPIFMSIVIFIGTKINMAKIVKQISIITKAEIE